MIVESKEKYILEKKKQKKKKPPQESVTGILPWKDARIFRQKEKNQSKLLFSILWDTQYVFKWTVENDIFYSQ